MLLLSAAVKTVIYSLPFIERLTASDMYVSYTFEDHVLLSIESTF